MKPIVVLLLSVALPVCAGAQTPSAPGTPTPETRTPTAPTTGAAGKTAPGAKATSSTNPATATKSTTAAKTTPGAKTPTTTAKAPATKGAADKSAKKDEPPPKIEGLEIARGAKGFLGLQVVDGTFKLSFYDPKKKPVAADVVRAMLRWTPNYKPGNEIYMLVPGGDGKSLTAAKVVRPPYQFKLFISLFAEGSDDPKESYVVDFAQ